MNEWSLPDLFSGLHDDIQQKLRTVRETIAHPVAKGSGSENVWLELMQTYLPYRYQVETAHIVDSQGRFSEQIDVVVFDRQYSPFIFDYQDQKIIPAESVYAVFETKQSIDAGLIAYARKKVLSVRDLHRTSLPIPHAGGVYPAKPLHSILGGILSLESEWSPALGDAFRKALGSGAEDDSLDLGCIAARGYFQFDRNSNSYEVVDGGKPATAFLLTLIGRLQSKATVPMIDIGAYHKWL